MFYIFHGPDELSRSEAVARLRAQMGDASMAELNTAILEGETLSLGELRQICDSLPFMSDRRLVIVHNYLTRLAGGGKRDKEVLDELVHYLPAMPDSTRLVFVEENTLPRGHPVLKLATAHEQGHVQAFDGPGRGELTGWIVRRVEARGASIERPAADALAIAVGDDLRLLDSEIEKLAIYVGDERPITTGDVELLVPYAGTANVFAMVDAIGRRDGRTALRLLHKLLDENAAPLYLLSMIVRQFRILIQVKELSAQGLAASSIARQAGLHPFVAEKAGRQALNFSMGQLEVIYARLLETDLAIKTGQLEDVLALDTLVAALCGPGE
ncbi:MAG: DNA polymerase III subunit delta [Anaerolineae bacterium]